MRAPEDVKKALELIEIRLSSKRLELVRYKVINNTLKIRQLHTEISQLVGQKSALLWVLHE